MSVKPTASKYEGSSPENKYVQSESGYSIWRIWTALTSVLFYPITTIVQTLFIGSDDNSLKPVKKLEKRVTWENPAPLLAKPAPAAKRKPPAEKRELVRSLPPQVKEEEYDPEVERLLKQALPAKPRGLVESRSIPIPLAANKKPQKIRHIESELSQLLRKPKLTSNELYTASRLLGYLYHYNARSPNEMFESQIQDFEARLKIKRTLYQLN